MSKPAGPCFDKHYARRAAIRKAAIHECEPFFRAHYLRRRPGVVPLVLVLEVDGVSVGMVCFGLPPRETERRYGTTVWELARLWIDDAVPANGETWTISQAIRYVRRNHPDVGLLVSYADPAFGHNGTIYRAANWQLDGRTDEGRKTPRVDYAVVTHDLLGTRVKKFSRRGHVHEDVPVQRIPRSSKFRYIYPLSSKTRAPRTEAV